MPAVQPDHDYVTPEQLCIGLYIYIDLPWFSHPFSFNSFTIRDAEQIRILRGLGVSRFRYDPDRSSVAPHAGDVPPTAPATAPEAPPTPQPPTADDPALAAKRERIAKLGARKEQMARVEKAFLKAANIMRNINRNLFSRSQECLEEAGELIGQLVAAFLEQPDVTLHVLGEKAGGEEVYFHGLNTSILSMMLAKELKVSIEQSRLLGLGALLHDVGLIDVPDRVARRAEELNQSERKLRELHCEYGVRRGQQLGLPPEVLLIIAQHHELADGSGYPSGLIGAKMSPLARIVSLVNYYDNLCNPADIARALTPHEALSLMFAQRRSKFDAAALQLMIRCLGVYPPGTVVKLSNDVLALVSSVNPQKPLRPWVLLYDPDIPKEEAIFLDLEQEPDINISKALRPIQLPTQVYDYLSPRKRVTYYFDAEAAGGRPA